MQSGDQCRTNFTAKFCPERLKKLPTSSRTLKTDLTFAPWCLFDSVWDVGASVDLDDVEQAVWRCFSDGKLYRTWFLGCCIRGRCFWALSCSYPPCFHSHLGFVSHISAALAAVMITEPTWPDQPASSCPSSLPWRDPSPHCSLSLSVFSLQCELQRPSERTSAFFSFLRSEVMLRKSHRSTNTSC